MIEFAGVTKIYAGGNRGLREVDLAIAPGAFCLLCGHSGAGKTTLLRLIALLERATAGHIVVDGLNLDRVPREEVPFYRRRIGMVFQDHRLLTQRTVFDNVALPLVVAGVGATEIRKRVRAALDKVDLLARERALPHTLSTGEQQRVGIARAVVNRPAMLLADEPTGNLDRVHARDILRLFDQFNQVGVTVVIATHDPTLCEGREHAVVELRDGALVADGRPQSAA